MSRRPSASVVANPVLVGAITVLVVVVAVFLAYNANNGLPFVPTRELKVDVANASNLVKGNDVREGGYRIGVLQYIKPVQLKNGVSAAELTLKLDQRLGRIPIDSRVKIRPRSALGLKYIELTRGAAKKVFDDGATLPASQTIVPVQFDDVYSTFDEPTRAASQRNLTEFGNAVAGRGSGLNVAIRNLPELFRHAQPVAQNLADPRTGLPRFFGALNRAASTVAPVAGTNARLFTALATTFAAFAHDTGALEATISKSPSTLDVSTLSLHDQRPFLNDTTAFSPDLSAAAEELHAALPTINPALEIGAPVLRRSIALDARLQDAMGSLRDLARAPSTNLAIRALNGTVTTLQPQLRYLGPFQTVCDYWNYFWTYLAEHLSEKVSSGLAQRALLNTNGQQTDSTGSAGAIHPANGQGYQDNPLNNARGSIEYLHGQPYGAAITSSGAADCENGQRGYPMGRLAQFAPKGYFLVTDPNTPGAQGPTFAGRPRVPPRETFTRQPLTGDRNP